jgi:uncharacterized protein Veg
VNDDTRLYGKGICSEAKNGKSKEKNRRVNLVMTYQEIPS